MDSKLGTETKISIKNPRTTQPDSNCFHKTYSSKHTHYEVMKFEEIEFGMAELLLHIFLHPNTRD